VARDATARLYDVDAESVVLDKKAATITFRAKKGRTVDLDRLHESIWATRLGDRTGMELRRLYVTAEGQAAADGKDVVLKVPGADRPFVLGEDPDSRPNEAAESPFDRLRAALERGEKVVAVTGRVEGWTGNFTRLLGKLPGKPRRLLVTEFRTAGR
jgi:hypothetical protein